MNIHQGPDPKLSEISWAHEPLAGALDNCSLLGIRLRLEKVFCKYSISTYFPLWTLFLFKEKIFSLLLCKLSSNNLPFLTDLLVILNCLIHNLWEEMISYELQMHPWNYLFGTGCSRCCIRHRDHMVCFCSEIGGRIILGFLVHRHTHALMWICRYRWSWAFTCACDFLRLTESKHPTSVAALSKKRHKRHLITFVRFIWGDSYLSNSPVWDNSKEEMGWVCTSGKWSFFLSFFY